MASELLKLLTTMPRPWNRRFGVFIQALRHLIDKLSQNLVKQTRQWWRFIGPLECTILPRSFQPFLPCGGSTSECLVVEPPLLHLCRRRVFGQKSRLPKNLP